MSTISITELPSATTPLTNSEVIPLVQNNVTKKATLSDVGSSITYKRTGDVNAVTRTVQSKLSDIISVWDFIPEGTDTNTVDCTNYIQNALNYAFNRGGGEVYLPAGVYRTTAPMIVRSNVHFRGDGAGSVIRRTGTGGSPFGNAIHIGYGYEYSYDRQYFSPTFDNDATIAQLLAGNLTRLTTRNAKVSNIYVKDQTAGKGLGIWTMNARDCVIDSMWFENTKTPVNLANDASGWQAACYNMMVSNIFQVSVDTGNDSWYDIAFTGSVLNATLKNCCNNPNTPSYLDGVFALGGHNLVVEGNTINGNDSNIPGGQTKIGFLYIGASVNTNYEVVFSNNIVSNFQEGMVIFQCGGISITDNYIYSCGTGIRLPSKRCIIDGNIFRSNTTDLVGNGDSTFHTISNNKGLSTLVNPDLPRWEQLVKFIGNTDLTGNPQTESNGNSYGPLTSRVLNYFAIDGVVSSTDRAKAGFTQDGNIRVNSGQTITVYYKLPTFVKRLREISVYLYADGAGDAVTIKLVGQTAPANTSGFLVNTTLATGTSAGAGDWGVGTGTISQYLWNNGGYLIAVEYAPANSSSQLRQVGAYVTCDA
jgi:polygalacturonase